MNYKIVYDKDYLHIELEGDDQEAFKEDLKLLNSLTKTVDEVNIIKQSKTLQSVPENYASGRVMTFDKVTEYKPIEFATPKQIDLMTKWKIEIPENCSKNEATALLHQYKRDHNMEDR